MPTKSNGKVNGSSFRTSNTSLASWLIINEIKLLEIDRESSPAVYVFEKPSEELLLDWDADSAFGNCAKFFKTYRSLLKRVMGKDNG